MGEKPGLPRPGSRSLRLPVHCGFRHNAMEDKAYGIGDKIVIERTPVAEENVEGPEYDDPVGYHWAVSELIHTSIDASIRPRCGRAKREGTSDLDIEEHREGAGPGVRRCL